MANKPYAQMDLITFQRRFGTEEAQRRPERVKNFFNGKYVAYANAE